MTHIEKNKSITKAGKATYTKVCITHSMDNMQIGIQQSVNQYVATIHAKSLRCGQNIT